MGVREVLNLILKCSFFPTTFSKVTGFIYSLVLRLVISNNTVVLSSWFDSPLPHVSIHPITALLSPSSYCE